MSVVNKMLNDLEQRGSIDDPDALDGEYNQPAEAKRIKTMVLFIVAVVSVAASYFTYRTLGDEYFIALYDDAMAMLGKEEAKPQQDKKVQVNNALNQMMPTRQGQANPIEDEVATPEQPVSLSDVAPQMAELAEQITDANAQQQVASTRPTPQPVGLIPQGRTEVVSQEIVADSPVTSEEDPESSVESSPPQITRSSDEDNSDARIAELNSLVALAISEKRVAAAAAYLREILGIKPTEHEARKRLAVLLFSSGDVNGARSLLGDGINLTPNRPDFRLMLARISFKEQNFLETYETLEPLEPNIQRNLEYYVLKANVSKELGLFAEASHLYGRLALYEPDRAQWWLGLAVSLDKSGEATGAVKAYERASDLRQLSASAEDFIRERIEALGG